MKLPSEIGEAAISDIIGEHPAIGEILTRHGIGCVGCGVGICQVKDVVYIHALGEEAEAAIEQDIRNYLERHAA